MNTDLFAPAKPKCQQLLEWIRLKKWVKTSEVCKWGVQNGSSDRAARNARNFRKQGKIFRMRKDLQELRYSGINEDVYTIYESEAELRVGD